jgi:hypothetical protein
MFITFITFHENDDKFQPIFVRRTIIFIRGISAIITEVANKVRFYAVAVVTRVGFSCTGFPCGANKIVKWGARTVQGHTTTLEEKKASPLEELLLRSSLWMKFKR